MVDYGLKKLHGWLTNHGQPWSTFKYLFLPFLSENPMAEPWPAKLRLVQVPSILVENRYKVSLLTWDSFKLECNDYTKANFKVCKPASKWVSVWSPYFCIDIFSGVRSQKLVQCESEITKRPQTGICHVQFLKQFKATIWHDIIGRF